MTGYATPARLVRPELGPRTAYLIASGDLRESANVAGWATQVVLESVVARALEANGWKVVRANAFDPTTGHGFISSQRMGLEVFKSIPEEAPLIVAEAVWQYSHHVLAGLRTHRGPILTVANFAGEWPGLVGLLGLNAGLTKMNTPYSTIWTVDGTDEWFQAGIRFVAGDGGHRARRLSRATAACPPGQPGDAPGPGPRQSAPDRESNHRGLRRGLHGHVPRHHRRRAAQPDRHLQGTTLAEHPVGRDADRQRRGRRRSRRLAQGRRNDLQDWRGRGHRADRGTAHLAVQDVHRCDADQ